MRIRVGALLCALAGAATTAGCTLLHTSFPMPQSHFDYPNSNVVPLGHAKGVATKPSFGMPQIMDPDLIETAVQNALREKGGDLLIDYTLTTKVVSFPVLPIYTTNVTVEGTAVKMEVGKQKLR